MFLVVRHNELHRAPMIKNHLPARILDLGTGTGIWAIDMADKYPEAEVIGVDLSVIQPKWWANPCVSITDDRANFRKI